jgi:histidinol-phosphate aminotransferase
MPHLWKIKQPYNVNVAASEAAIASLADSDWLEEKVSKIREERKRLEQLLAQVSFLAPYPSRSNFVLCRVEGRDARHLKLALENEGILVRHFAKPGLENCIRVTAGRPEETDHLLQALHSLENGNDAKSKD